MFVSIHFSIHFYPSTYGVATSSRLLKTIGLFCRISSLLQGSFANKTYNSKEPTHRSHPMVEVSPEIYFCYGVATVSRIDKIIGLFCRILSLL